MPPPPNAHSVIISQPPPPRKKSSFWTPSPLKFKIWTPKNGPSLRISESIRVPSPSPMDLRPLPLPSAALLMTFLWVASWSYEPYFWLNWGKLYYPSPDWSSAFCERWTNVLSVEYTVYIHFVRYTSVSHTAKSFSNHYPLICESTINVQHLHLNKVWNTFAVVDLPKCVLFEYIC